MKAHYRFFVFLFPAILTSVIAFSQDCQLIVPVLQNSDPPWSPVDSVIDLCLGDTLFLEAVGDYPENGLNYNQSDATSTFDWNFGDGSTLQGQSVFHVYGEPGGYAVALTITDTLECVNDEPFILRVRVYGPPLASYVQFPEAPYCPGTELALYPNLTPDTFSFQNFTNDLVLLIPDGNGASVHSVINISEFGPDETLDDPTALEGICAVLEHSWMRDLDIRIACPDGTEVYLQQFAGQTGSEVFLGVPFEADEGAPVPGQGYEYCWRDDATSGTMLGYANMFMPPTLPAGDYNPSEPLADLVGCPLNGDWTLKITDLWALDNGFIFSWWLDFSNSFISEHNLPDTSFYAEITNLTWLTDSTVQSIVGDTVIAQLPNAHTFYLTVEDEEGCSYELSHAVGDVLPVGAPACAPCSTLVADAGLDTLYLDCFGSPVFLGGAGTSIGAYLEYEWVTPDGLILSGWDQPTALAGSIGTYQLTVTSQLSGCVAIDEVIVLNNLDAPIADAGEDVVLQCSIPTYVLDGSGSSAGPNFIYQWAVIAGNGTIFNNDQTINPEIGGSGTYQLTVTDTSNGCSATDEVEVELSTGLLVDLDLQPASCDGADGGATVLLLPGTPPTTVLWSDGQTGLSAENLAEGWYSVTVTADECSTHENFYIDEDLSCKVVVQGTVFNDSFNQDCADDSFTVPIECIMLHLLPDDVYTYADQNGQYEFIAESGDYTVELIDEDVYSLLCPAGGTIDVSLPDPGSVSAGNDFFLTKDPFENLCVNLSTGPARPGFEVSYTLTVCNLGEQPASATLTFVHAPELEDVSLSASALTYDPDSQTATWFFPDMPSGNCQAVSFKLSLPAGVALGAQLPGSAAVTPVSNDVFPYNNQINWSQTVVGSFDPNDKTSFTGEDQFGGAIYFPQDSVIDYQIRFQNTGTDTAFTVVVKDTLDANLDVETIRPGSSSHDMLVEFEGNNVLVFTFENIYLPDSTTNLEGSQGFVTFSIRPRPGLPVGTQIPNSAAIFFDYNAPVITNETVHVVSEETGVFSAPVQDSPWLVYPNPAVDWVELAGLEGEAVRQAFLYDQSGRLIAAPRIDGHRIDLSAMPAGMYHLMFEWEGRWYREKVVIARP